MKQIDILTIFMLFISQATRAQNKGDEDKNMFNELTERDRSAVEEATNGWWAQADKNRKTRIKWWQKASFGMFIHWGPYAVAGGEWEGKPVGGYAEHLMRVKKISRQAYLRLIKQFNPIDFNAEEWVGLAKRAGMRYLIVTAKHHDGFAMYPTAFSTDYSISNTPFKRDPMQELAEACRRQHIKFGFYYSHAFDWEHPNAPGNDWDYSNPGGDKLLGGRNWFDTHPEWLPKVKKYVDEKSIPQILELIKRYHPDILWFDTPHKLPLSENLRILKAIRAADPKVVVNGRLARTAQVNFGDYFNTADRPAEFYPFQGDWEAIPTTNESYGYSKYDGSHKSAAFQIRLLAKARAKGGNLLMNIGPMGNGKVDPRDVRILDSLAIWMKQYDRSLIGAHGTSLPTQNWGVITQKGDTLFLHVFHHPKDGKLLVGGLLSSVKDVRFMNGDAITVIKQDRDGLWLDVGNEQKDPVDEVITITCIPPVRTDGIRRLVANNYTNRLLAFDAVWHGRGFHYGDGKATRYYVEGWKHQDQYLTWPIKQLAKGKYRITVKYLANKNTGGVYRLSLGTFSKDVPILASGEITAVQIGEVALQAGMYELMMRPLHIRGAELMKLYEVRLEPMME